MPEASSPDQTLDQHKHGVAEFPVEELLLRRWSPRAFAEKPVSDADLRAIFTAAAWAASSYNEQPWRFAVGRKGDAIWTNIFDALLPLNQGWANKAPVLYATFAKKTFSHNGTPNSVALHDVGAASANLSLQATALGLHTHGMAGFNRDTLRTAFAVPEDFEPVACWALGYLGDAEQLPEPLKRMESEGRSRKALEEFVFGDWGIAAL